MDFLNPICKGNRENLHETFRWLLRHTMLVFVSPLKKMKNAFYFTLKLFSFSRYLNFCVEFLVMQEKRRDYKDKVNLKSMTSQYCYHAIAITILLYISQSKGNQIMKFGQLIEYILC